MFDPILPIDIVTIQKCIPHRFPFLLIDRVTHLVPGKSVTATKLVSIADPFLQGHFPGFPVFPGVLVLEGMAQTSAILGHYTLEGFKDVFLTEVLNARFRKKIIPGDVIRYEMTVEKKRNSFFWFEGKAFVGDEVVTTAYFSALMK